MNVERVKNALDIIKSGKYQQCFNYMRAGDCHCFAGAFCDISEVGEWAPMTPSSMQKMSEGPYYEYVVPNSEGPNTSIPDEVRKHFGFTWEQTERIIVENDAGRTFTDLCLMVGMWVFNAMKEQGLLK